MGQGDEVNDALDFSSPLARADDAVITAALEHAVIPPLLVALAATLDDVRVLPPELRPELSQLMDPTAGLDPEQQSAALRLAHEALLRLRQQGPEANPRARGADELRPLLAFLTGVDDVDGYLDLARDELALGEDARAPKWHKDEICPERPFRVVVIGAGMSGLVAALRLRQAGLDVVVIEKDEDVGGTWLENSYPGCRVDVSNHFYGYSFAQRTDWPDHYSPRDVLLDYFRGVADHHDLRPLIRFSTEVRSVRLDEASMRWTVDRDGPGGGDTIEADAVVSAVGQLNRPHIPAITGAERFTGPAFHSARWDHDLDLTGRRVAVIGTGASAAQLIPPVAEQVSQLTIFQRTPAWFLPTPDYTDPVPPEVQWLFREVPGYAAWYRFWIFWNNVEGLMPAAAVDPEWDGHPAAVGPLNDLVRQLFTAYIEMELGDRRDLLEKVLPDYPVFSKRFIRDDGAWARTLKQDHVALVTEPIAEIAADGVRTTDGAHHAADVIVYGTGFTASDFLVPMQVVGRDGVDLHERWGDDARAHLGITLPGFPNLFMLYGPNTNIVVNGSITFFSECSVDYIVECVRSVLIEGAAAIEPTQEAHDDHNRRVDAENARMAWGVATVNSWYRNATGRSAQNWPFSLLDYWRATRRPEPSDHVLHRRPR
jgi:4-hydroxyacetophenone monooxygenase